MTRSTHGHCSDSFGQNHASDSFQSSLSMFFRRLFKPMESVFKSSSGSSRRAKTRLRLSLWALGQGAGHLRPQPSWDLFRRNYTQLRWGWILEAICFPRPGRRAPAAAAVLVSLGQGAGHLRPQPSWEILSLHISAQ
jgi:hypothetical protein